MPLPSKVDFVERIRSLDPYEFEKFIADVWEARGWKTSVSPQAGDRGVDVTATRSDPFHQKQVIQVKRYAEGNKVGSPEVQRYASLRQQVADADIVVIVTSGRFSEEATSLADDLNVKLVDVDDLYGLLRNDAVLEVYESRFGQQHTNNPPSETAGPEGRSNSSDQPIPTADVSDEDDNSLRKSLIYLVVGVVAMLVIAVMVVGGGLLLVTSGTPSEGGSVASESPTPLNTINSEGGITASRTPTPTTVVTESPPS